MDYCMPYMIQVMREYHTKIEALDKKAAEKEEKKKQAAKEPQFGGVHAFASNLALMPPGMAAPQINPSAPFGFPQQPPMFPPSGHF